MLRWTLTAVVVTSIAAPASALTIVSHYRKTGANLAGIGVAGDPSPNTVGGGDIADVFRAAAGVWESLILDDFTLTLNFGWHPTEPVSLTAYHHGVDSGGTPRRETRGSIAFNNDNADGRRWFLDPTPLENSEFGPLVTSRTDFGAGLINSRRDHVPASADTIGSNDLFAVALHEIGHALGLTGWSFFDNEVADGDVDLTQGPFAGSAIPITGPHIDLSGPSLSSRGRPVGYRREVSDVDVLAVSQVSRFTQYVLSPRSDFDGDRDVDGADLAAWENAFGPTNFADTDGDGDSDGADFLIWQRQLTTVSAGGTTAIPEPAASTLVLCGSTMLLCLRARERMAAAPPERSCDMARGAWPSRAYAERPRRSSH